METNVSLIIAAIIMVILIVILPVYNVFTRQDDMSYNLALKATSNFVDKVRTSGTLDYDMYQKFIDTLNTTKNSYNVELEIYTTYLVKNGTSDEYKEEYLIEYTQDIIRNLQDSNKYNLNRGDRFYVRINNTNITKADSFLSSIKFIDSKSKIDIDYGGVILVNSVR